MATNFVRDGKKMKLVTITGAESGDAFVIGGYLPCVLLTDADAADSHKATVQTEGVFSLSAKGDGGGSNTIVAGDMLYWTDKDTPLDKDATEDPFGIALEGSTHATNAIDVLLVPKATIPDAVSTTDIDNKAVTVGKMADLASTNILVGDSGNRPLARAMSGDATLANTGALTIGADKILTAMVLAKNITGAKLADAIQDSLITFGIASVDGTDGTAAVTIQAKDSEGNELAKNVLIRAWTAATTMGVPAASTDLAVAADGLIITEHLANADIDIITDATGEAVLTITDTAGTYYLMTECQGVVTSTTITITGP